MYMKINIIYLILCAAIIGTGCTSDYEIFKPAKEMHAGESNPEIDVTPLSADFGFLSAGHETRDIVVTIKNIGTDDLEIMDVYIHESDSNFYLASGYSGIIEPFNETEVVVTYSPTTYETNSATLKILSNDSDEQTVSVVLDGAGDAPIIRVTPDFYDFGSVYLGCDQSIPVIIENIGNVDLIVTDIEYFSSVPVDFSLSDYEAGWGVLPLVIPSGDYIDLSVSYEPFDILDDSAYIEVTSNDPATPIEYSSHDAIGDYEKWIRDFYTQDGIVDVDILFVVDNSGSMNSNQTNLKNNFDSFINAFSAAGASYHIGIITTDEAAFVGDVITNSTVDPIGEFNDQVDTIGTHGSAHEKGLWYAYQSTVAGDASAGSSTGFFRPSARLVVVYISDEPDFSHQTYSGGGSTTMVHSDYTASLLTLKASPSLVVAHAIAGDYPSGCTSNGGAQFGEGYYDVVTALGGTFMSICATDWSTTMDTLARESIAMTEFELSKVPIEETIKVFVDGVESTDWIYDSSQNSITFTIIPNEGSSIDIDYAIWSDCEEE